MWTNELTVMMAEGVRDTLLMTLVSTLFGYILGPVSYTHLTLPTKA